MRPYRELSETLSLHEFEQGFFRSRLTLSASEKWTHKGGSVRGDAYVSAQILPSGDLFLYLRNKSISNKFKHFALPSQITLFANSSKQVIQSPGPAPIGTAEGFPLTHLSHVNSQMGNRPSEKQDLLRTVVSAECDVSYILTKFQSCGRILTFDRTWAEASCGGGLRESTVGAFRGFTYEDTKDAVAYLQTLNLEVGEVSTLLGKGPVAHDGTQFHDGGVWRILRIR
jgi:hypothetical protein